MKKYYKLKYCLQITLEIANGKQFEFVHEINIQTNKALPAAKKWRGENLKLMEIQLNLTFLSSQLFNLTLIRLLTSKRCLLYRSVRYLILLNFDILDHQVTLSEKISLLRRASWIKVIVSYLNLVILNMKTQDKNFRGVPRINLQLWLVWERTDHQQRSQAAKTLGDAEINPGHARVENNVMH